MLLFTEKTKYAPDPIDPPKYSYKPDYKPDDYKKPKDTYDSPKDDYEPPSDDYSPDKPDYGNDMPGYGNDKPSYGHAGDKPGYGIDKTGYGYKPSKKPYDTYTPVDHPVCKSKNVCEKKGYKCCACADCNSLSFGCAETCACCPRVSISNIMHKFNILIFLRLTAYSLYFFTSRVLIEGHFVGGAPGRRKPPRAFQEILHG